MKDGQDTIGILAYADDIVLLAESNEELQRSIDEAHKWCNTWGMKANVEKCGVQAFGLPKNTQTPKIKWGNFLHFPLAKDYKYLGLSFETDMKWTKHTKKIHDAALGKLNKLKFLFRNKRLNYKLRKHLYEENIRSRMQYGNIAWASGKGKKNAAKLNKIQKRLCS